MSKIFTNSFKTFNISKIVESNPSFYIFLGKHQPFIDDLQPPAPLDRVDDTYMGAYDSMIVAKSIGAADIAYMIPRHDWATGTKFKAYRNTAGDLYGNAFYTSVPSASGYDVFKCLSNNNTSSTVAPDVTATSPSDDVYETADGYQWKYMYSIPTVTFDKFATRDYIPVFANNSVSGNATPGAIDYIDVVYGGSHYNTYAAGTIQVAAVSGNTRQFVIESSASSESNFYNGSSIKIISGTGAGQLRRIVEYNVSGLTRTVVVDTEFDTLPTNSSTYEISPEVVVVGSGTEFQGRALVNTAASNSIYKVEIVNRGSNYYYANAVVVGNTGGVSNAATLSVVIGPRDGHGYDPIKELGGKYLCLTTTFDSTDATAEGKLVDANEFRSIGVLVDPKYANVELSYTGATGTFTIGETVTQSHTGAFGTIADDTASVLTLRNVTGNFNAGNTSYNYITGSVGVTKVSATVTSVRNNGSVDMTANTDYVNTTTRLIVSSQSGTFTPDEVVVMSGNTATAVVYYTTADEVWITSIRGPITVGSSVSSANGSATATITGVVPSDFLYGTGDILYLENISPINKASGQTETIKAIIEF